MFILISMGAILGAMLLATFIVSRVKSKSVERRAKKLEKDRLEKEAQDIMRGF